MTEHWVLGWTRDSRGRSSRQSARGSGRCARLAGGMEPRSAQTFDDGWARGTCFARGPLASATRVAHPLHSSSAHTAFRSRSDFVLGASRDRGSGAPIAYASGRPSHSRRVAHSDAAPRPHMHLHQTLPSGYDLASPGCRELSARMGTEGNTNPFYIRAPKAC